MCCVALPCLFVCPCLLLSFFLLISHLKTCIYNNVPQWKNTILELWRRGFNPIQGSSVVFYIFHCFALDVCIFLALFLSHVRAYNYIIIHCSTCIIVLAECGQPCTCTYMYMYIHVHVHTCTCMYNMHCI